MQCSVECLLRFSGCNCKDEILNKFRASFDFIFHKETIVISKILAVAEYEKILEFFLEFLSSNFLGKNPCKKLRIKLTF